MPNERRCPWCGAWFWDYDHDCPAPAPTCPICGEDSQYNLVGPDYCQECQEKLDKKEQERLKTGPDKA